MFDIDRLMKVMSEILSDMYDCKITLTAIPKDQAAGKEETNDKRKEDVSRRGHPLAGSVWE